MREKARIIAKLAAKYRALAFFVNALGVKTQNLTFAVNQGYPESRRPTGKTKFVNTPYRGCGAAILKGSVVVASL